MKVKLSNEELFLADFIFNKYQIEKSKIRTLNFESLIKITSSHLLIPTLYFNLKVNNLYSRYVPKEFYGYLEEIFEINRERNKKLIDETNHISKIFDVHSIDYCFLKGASLINRQIFGDIGERMVGDIDILISKNEKNRVIDILNKYDYFSKYRYELWDANVSPNFINKEKVFAIDLHNELFPKKYNFLLNTEEFLKNPVIKDEKKIPNLNNEYLYNIYNYQISDFGYLKGSYSYRKIYDVMNLKKEINIGNKFNDRLYKRFFLVSQLIGIKNPIDTGSKKISPFTLRFKLKKEYKIFRRIDIIFCELLIFLMSFRFKIAEFLVNNKYRKNTISKIKNLFSVKS